VPREIERKFLVEGDSWRQAATARREFVQAYLADTARAVIRIRMAESTAWLTIKSAAPGLIRDEFEYPIPPADAASLIALCDAQVAKTRFDVPHAGRLWEVDVYSGENEGLVIAEIELPSATSVIELPPWAGAEVTADPRFYASRLAREPFRQWAAGAQAGTARG